MPDGTLSLPALEAEICSLASHIHAATCRWLCLVAEFDRREGWAAWGARSCAHWVAWRCAIAPVSAREHVRVARRLVELPAVRAAFARGELSYAKVRAITRVDGLEREGDLLGLARHATAAQLERLVRAHRRVLAVERGARGARPERWLTYHHDDDGSLVLHGRLPAEEGAVLIAALDAAHDRLTAASAHARRDEPGAPAEPRDASAQAHGDEATSRSHEAGARVEQPGAPDEPRDASAEARGDEATSHGHKAGARGDEPAAPDDEAERLQDPRGASAEAPGHAAPPRGDEAAAPDGPVRASAEARGNDESGGPDEPRGASAGARGHEAPRRGHEAAAGGNQAGVPDDVRGASAEVRGREAASRGHEAASRGDEAGAGGEPLRAREDSRDVSAEALVASAGEARADALMSMAETLLAGAVGTRTGGDRYQVLVHVDTGTLREDDRGALCELDDGTPLAAETARRLACDAAIVPILERGGRALSVGRKTRAIPPALRRALGARDRGCRFPGCTARNFIDAHHIQPWAHGGETSLHNLVQVCRHHHRLLHEGGYTLTHHPDGELTFHRPDGLRIADCPDVPPGGHAAVHTRRIRPDACLSLSHGERMDLDLGVDWMLAFAPPPPPAPATTLAPGI